MNKTEKFTKFSKNFKKLQKIPKKSDPKNRHFWGPKKLKNREKIEKPHQIYQFFTKFRSFCEKI